MSSEKNSEFRIKVGNYHPYSENIVRFENYSKLARRKFRISFATFGAISEPHSEKNSEVNPEISMIRSCPDRSEFKNECYSTVNQSISKKQRYLH